MVWNRAVSQGASRFVGKALGTYLRFGLFLVFLLFIVLNSIMIGIEQKSIEPVIEDLGQRFVAPTYQLLEMSKQIQQDGIIGTLDSSFLNVIYMIKNYALLFFNIYAIYMWIKFIFWLLQNIDTSRRVFWFIMAILIFLMIQWLYIAFFTEGSLMDPLYAFTELFKALPVILHPFTEIAVEQALTPETVCGIVNGSSGC